MGSLATVLADGFDRELFEAALARVPALAGARDRAARLLPHPEALLADLFAVLYKLNVVLLPEADLSPSVLLHRRLLRAVVATEPLERLRARTGLDEHAAGAAAAALAEDLLDVLTRAGRVDAGELVELAAAAHDEAAAERIRAELARLDELPPGSFEGRDALEASLQDELVGLERRVAEARAAQSKLAEGLSSEMDGEAGYRVGRLSEELDEAEAAARALGLSAGGDGAMSAGASLELGRRLLRSRELRLLARLTGAFKEVAFEARRRRVVRAPQELHDVRRGAELERLLPSELLGLPRHRAALHLEFLRRFAERELLGYELEGAAERGPMVICVDGSGSMRGSKELWAKAVALTLMEIARRERRRCLAIVFSAGQDMLELELLEGPARSRGRARVRDAELLRFAEHFPGGGTSFEEPIGRAVEAVSTGRYRWGDVVFITDGEATVTEALVRRVDEARRLHRFRLRGVLVDVAASRASSLERLCDEVRRVSDLTAESMGELFASV